MPKATADLIPITPLHNLSLGEIVDQLGHAKVAAADAKATEDALRTALIARGVSEAEGALFRVAVTSGTRWTLNAEAIREEMGELWAIAHSKVSTITSVRVSARTGARKAA